jgi:hypothetical protein
MKNILLLFALMAFSCTEISYDETILNNMTVIEGDSIIVKPIINIDFRPNINVTIIDSTTIMINNYILNDITVIDSNTIVIGGDTITINVTNPTQPCVAINTAPIVVILSQPTETNPFGTALVYGLPSGNWTLKRLPDNISITGSGNVVVVTGLNPRWSVDNGAKCYSTIFSWYVINECGFASPISNEVTINTWQ